MNKKRIKIHQHLSSLGRKVSDLKSFNKDNYGVDESRNIRTELVDFDFSKQRINKEALDFLLELPDELDLRGSLDSLFKGDFHNPTEKRNVSHTLYRSESIDNNKVIYSEKNKVLKDKYLENLFGLGEERVFSNQNESFGGKIIGVDDAGRLLVRSKGSILSFQNKEIMFL